MNNDMKLDDMFAEYLRIYKFVNHQKIVDALESELGEITNVKRKIYELSNGVRSTTDIKREVGTAPSTITSYWKQWALSGIVIPASRKGRYMAAFNLKEYGLSAIEDTETGDEE